MANEDEFHLQTQEGEDPEFAEIMLVLIYVVWGICDRQKCGWTENPVEFHAYGLH